MNLLPPMELREGIASTTEYEYTQNGDPFDFTGYTAAWRIVQGGKDVAMGTPALSLGRIAVTVSALQTQDIEPARQLGRRSVAVIEISADDGASFLRWQANVVMERRA